MFKQKAEEIVDFICHEERLPYDTACDFVSKELQTLYEQARDEGRRNEAVKCKKGCLILDHYLHPYNNVVYRNEDDALLVAVKNDVFNYEIRSVIISPEE